MLKALELLKSLGEVLRVSTIYESKAWGVVNQGDFLNCVVKFKTELEPVELLKRLKEIEKLVGRKERERWGPREIDIDILLYENYILMLSFLVVPHPYLTRGILFWCPCWNWSPSLSIPFTRDPSRNI
jgi:2-amino-4-hydroxy-6-hydroxymethyldihydropteridine diphosphokinase